jgi:hypothetical protein
MLIGSLLFFQLFFAFDLINPSSVEKGMRGIALSTFEGNKIDTIEVEILGTMPDYQLGKDVIIAKLEGKVVDEAGVLAGMSGSPVYIEGKLLGAIAYGWTFSKEPICGITLFSDMKKIGTKKSIGGFSSFTPIKPVLTVAGFSPSSISYLDSLPFDFTVSETILGGKTKCTTRLEPGGVCGVTLVSGDGNVSAMGTITEVIGDTIFALGHSAYATGTSVLPLCGGSVLTYLPSLFKSFKFATPGDIIGKVVFDGRAGIKAIIGVEPPMVACNIRIGDLVKRYKVAAEKSIFTAIPPFLVFSNWIEEMGQYENVTVSGKVNIWTDKGGLSFPVAISGEEIQRDLYQWVRDPLTVIQKNEFEGIEIDSISVNLSSEGEIRQYFVKDFSVEKNKFDPDEMIKVNVILSRYRKRDTTINFNFKAPDSPCDLLFRIAGRSEYIGFELSRAPLKFEFDYFDEWKDFLNTLPPPDMLIFSVYKKEPSLITDAGEIKNPPPSLRMLAGKGGRKIIRDLYPIFEKKIKFDGPISGEGSYSVEIRR